MSLLPGEPDNEARPSQVSRLHPCVPAAADNGAHPVEMPQLQHAEEDPLASRDAPADRTPRPSAGTGQDTSIRLADCTVIVICERREEEDIAADRVNAESIFAVTMHCVDKGYLSPPLPTSEVSVLAGFPTLHGDNWALYS